jgi:hypothetical protein
MPVMRTREIAGVALLTLLLTAGQAAAEAPYRLKAREIEALRSQAARNMSRVFHTRVAEAGMQRTLARVAGKRMARYEGVEKSVLMTFLGAVPLRGDFRGRIDGDRFLFGVACDVYFCPEPAWVVADLVSGHVGIVLAHAFDAAGQKSEGLLVTTFRMACANPELNAKLLEVAEAAPAVVPKLSRYATVSRTAPQIRQSACR